MQIKEKNIIIVVILVALIFSIYLVSIHELYVDKEFNEKCIVNKSECTTQFLLSYLSRTGRNQNIKTTEVLVSKVRDVEEKYRDINLKEAVNVNNSLYFNDDIRYIGAVSSIIIQRNALASSDIDFWTNKVIEMNKTSWKDTVLQQGILRRLLFSSKFPGTGYEGPDAIMSNIDDPKVRASVKDKVCNMVPTDQDLNNYLKSEPDKFSHICIIYDYISTKFFCGIGLTSAEKGIVNDIINFGNANLFDYTEQVVGSIHCLNSIKNLYMTNIFG